MEFLLPEVTSQVNICSMNRNYWFISIAKKIRHIRVQINLKSKSVCQNVLLFDKTTVLKFGMRYDIKSFDCCISYLLVDSGNGVQKLILFVKGKIQ